MTPNAFFMLLFRLRYMHLHPRIDAACVISQRTCGCRIRSVFRVKAHIHQDPPVFGSIVISVKIFCLLHAHKAAWILPCDVGDGSCNISLRPAVCKSPGHIIAEIIHIACGHDPESERFCQSQHGAPVNGIAIQFCLKREDFLVEPVLQFQIFSISTHKRHWRMGMSVVKSAHKQFASAIVFPFPFSCRALCTDRNDLPISNCHIAVLLQFQIFIQYIDLFKKHNSSFLSPYISGAIKRRI